MAKNAVERGKKVLILSHRSELLTQSGGALESFNLKPILIQGTSKLYTFNHNIYVGMAQTISRRLKKEGYSEFLNSFDLVIIDEAHEQIFNTILPLFNENCIVIGATATPERKGNQISLDLFYNKIVEEVKISELINLGFLAKPLTYGVKIDLSDIGMKGNDYDEQQVGNKFNEVKLYEGVYENYIKITPNKKTVIFASNVESSKQLVLDFKLKGLPIEHLDGYTDPKERKRILKWFKDTPNAMISNYGILTTGFDQPDIEVVILYRATKSLPLYLQMCGRGGRKTKDKNNFYILDFGNNVTTHGLWENDRDWSIKKKRKKDGIAPVKECPSCNGIYPIMISLCPNCKHIFEKSEEEKQEAIIAELKLLTNSDIKEKLKTADFKTLNDIQKAKGYSKRWVFHQLKDEKQLNDYAKYMGYKKQWVDYQLKNRM